MSQQSKVFRINSNGKAVNNRPIIEGIKKFRELLEQAKTDPNFSVIIKKMP